MSKIFKIYVVGITSENLCELEQLPPEVIADCKLFIGADKHHSLLKSYKAEVKAVTPLRDTLHTIKETLPTGNVVVLGSGDPLFYGIGSTLLKSFAQTSLVFYPALTAIQRASALFKTSWHDANIISLHGRTHPHLAGLFLSQHKSLVLTDGTNTPTKIAGEIADYLKLIEAEELAKNMQCMVAENIGTDKEQVFVGSLDETREKTDFSPLNVFCFIHKKQDEPSSIFGLSEQEIQHSRGLITKNAVRAACIHSLSLPRTGILWDIGGGSGSISIEAARIAPELIIYCVEQKDEEIANIKANIRRFGCYNIIPAHGNAAEIMTHLPDPDRVFVGGSGGKLEKIVKTSAEKLPQMGRIVVNSVLEKTAQQAPLFMQKNMLEVQSSTVSVCREKGTEHEQQLNPITITTGLKR